MRVMVIVKANEETESGDSGTEEMFTEMGKYNDELVNAGVMLAGEGLLPSKDGKRVLFDGTKRAVVDGPFAETKELIAGFWIWKVNSMEEAVEWAKKCPNTSGGQSELEIRRIGEMEDFGDLLTPEARALEEEHRQKTGNYAQG